MSTPRTKSEAIQRLLRIDDSLETSVIPTIDGQRLKYLQAVSMGVVMQLLKQAETERKKLEGES